MGEKSMTRSHGGGNMGRETIEKESLRGEAAESSGKHLGTFGIHFGALWEPFGRHLGGRRVKRHLEARSHIMCLTLEHNAKVPFRFQFYDVFLRVPSIMAAYLQLVLLPGSAADPAYLARPLYQDRENPCS